MCGVVAEEVDVHETQLMTSSLRDVPLEEELKSFRRGPRGKKSDECGFRSVPPEPDLSSDDE